jgi:hypothetical protein
MEQREIMSDSQETEGGSQSSSYEPQMVESLEVISKQYQDYWLGTDERNAVRNVLMQAMWLVCYGFRSFRHDTFCETLRMQPDFAEPANANSATTDSTFTSNLEVTKVFEETMKPIWEKQQAADRHVALKNDGDAAMNKGFAMKKAPWGVDPTAMQETTSLIETEMGVPEKEDMPNHEMASRLTFLLQNTDAPERVATPIQGLVSALQESEEASGKEKAKEMAIRIRRGRVVDAVPRLENAQRILSGLLKNCCLTCDA